MSKACRALGGPSNAVFTADEIVGTTEPVADVAVDMVDWLYTMPDEIPAGRSFGNSPTTASSGT